MLENHVELKVKPFEAKIANDSSLWDLYKIEFTVHFLWERCHPYPELDEALTPLIKVESKSVMNSEQGITLDLSCFVI